ncbi:MAG: response regulator [Lachnospiraceae bacterium]|nr:response regulator [Lachnospiraceae bacterium]
MFKKMQQNLRTWCSFLCVICMGAILWGGIHYISTLRTSLMEQAVHNVLTVTMQQQQAFDNFLAQDLERIHSYAEYLAQGDSDDTESIRRWLHIFDEVNALYLVFNLETGSFYSNGSYEVNQLENEELKLYRGLSGRGVREPGTGLYADDMRLGYYECFTFADGARGVIQKSYDCSKISEDFSLSFYNDQGLAYVVNREGDILIRSVGMLGDHLYANILEILAGHNDDQEKIDDFIRALDNGETDSIIFVGDGESFVYTYVPIENTEGWYLVSVVRENAITAEADAILLDSKIAVGILFTVLVICAVFVLLIWRTGMDIREKDLEIAYQEQLFDIFATYLANNTDDIYMMVDAEDKQVEYISPNAERILGISVQNITVGSQFLSGAVDAFGKTLDFDEMYRMKPDTSLRTMSEEWNNPETDEHRYFQISVYCTLVQDERKIIIYISDRTEDRAVQDALAEALRIAQVANDAKSAFLSNVSHDIRTPMNAITGFVALLQDEADNPDHVREYVQQIDAASQHLLGLINDVLDMNKIETGSATLNLSEVNLADIIDEINTIIRPQTKAKDQTFEIFSSSVIHEHLQADKLRINQILINLLSNSVKYTPESGTIQMRLDELPQVDDKYSRIRFTISDNGMGMSEEYLKVIFDPFTRENTEIISRIQGTGLGMAITKSLVDLMGGTITVQSELGKGSVFTVELELYISEKDDDPKFWIRHNINKMIVADDDETICLNVVKAMEQTGVIVEYATDGEKAVQMMRDAREKGAPYNLILLDWKMPNLDGLGTARLIRSGYSEKIPILIFTAYDWGEIEKEAEEIGVDHFMPKPFFITTFKEVIRRAMGSQKKVKPGNDSAVVKGKHVLVVDDIEPNRLVLVKILSSLGAVCDTACNGQEALELFTGSAPGTFDLILMDVQMPVLDGYAATKAIRGSGHPSAKTLPIIAMTANAFVDDIREAIESGMDAHIAKPIQLDKLKDTIEQVFDKRKQQETSEREEES